MRHVVLSAVLLSSVAFLDLGCSEAENTINCAQICDKYKDCFDDDLDTTDCIDRCEDKADSDSDFEEQVDSCEECLDDSSCTEGTVSCTDDCAWVVAEST